MKVNELELRLQQQRNTAEQLDSNLFLNNNYNIELELAVTRLNQRWQKLIVLVNKVRKNVDSMSAKWEQFQRLANELMVVSGEIRRTLGNAIPSVVGSSIEKLTEHFDHLTVSMNLRDLLVCLFVSMCVCVCLFVACLFAYF